MRLTFLVYTVCLLVSSPFLPCAFGQRENADSVLNAKMTERTKPGEIYFSALKAKMHDDNKLATELFEQFLLLKPDVSSGHYELSKLYNNEKKADKAEAEIKKAIALDGSNKWYKEQYATILAESGNFQAAADIIAGLTKTEPDDEEYPTMAAEYYERARKYDDALTYLDKAIVQSGADEDILMHKVQLYLEMNNVDKAAEVVRQLIAKDNRNGKYYKLLAELYDNNKFPAKAKEVYDTAQKMIPDDPSIQLGMAEHFLKVGDSVSYVAYIRKVILNTDIDADTQLELLREYLQTLPNDSILKMQGFPIIRQLVAQHPADAQVLSLYGDFLESTGQHDRAVAAYKKSLTIKPADFKVWEKLLNDYTGKTDADSLIKYSEKAMRLFPNQAVVHYYNGVGHLNKKDYAGAVKSINRAIDMQPETDKTVLSSMYALLGDIYHSSKQDDLSDAAFEKALQLAPDDPTILNNYSYYLSERGKKLDEAEKMSRKSLDAKLTEPTYLDTYGWILYKKGEYEKARQYIQKAVDLAGPNADATLFDHLGNVYYKLKDKDKAIEYWKKSKEKGGEDPQLDKKISEGKLYE